jgi:F-type H+-transporting ATPase subunit b
MKGWSLENLVKQSFLAFLIVILASVVAYAAGESGESHGHAGQMLDFGWRVINFVILIGLFYWLLRKKIKEFFAGRRADIKTSLEEAVAAKEEAEKKFKEYSAKLDKAAEEIEGISDMIRAQGLTEKEKIIESARITAEKMKVDAQARIEQELKNASSQLRTEAVELSTQMAEEILKKTIKKEDHENIVKDHLENLGSQTHSGQRDTN